MHLSHRANKREKKWTSKVFGSGTLEYYSDMNSGINAVINIHAINAAIENYPKISEIGFPCKCEGRNFTIKVDMKQVKVWMTQLALGIPVTIEQRISFI